MDELIRAGVREEGRMPDTRKPAMTEDFAHLSTEGFPPLKEPASPGAAPMLQWLATDLLVVDPTYQRPIGGKGRRNIRAIAEHFEWAKFSPVIVAPLAGGLYAVIDGQHRATAAILRDISQVPCQVVIIDRPRQAEAFAAINGAVTAVRAQQVYHAQLAAGDEEARLIDEVCRCAEVIILRNPRQASKLKRGETLAVQTIREEIRRCGRDTVIVALQCITQTGDGHTGLVSSPIITAFCEVLRAAPRWRDAGDELLAAVEEINLKEEYELAKTQRKEPGVTTAAVLAKRLRALLERDLGPVNEAPLLQAAE